MRTALKPVAAQGKARSRGRNRVSMLTDAEIGKMYRKGFLLVQATLLSRATGLARRRITEWAHGGPTSDYVEAAILSAIRDPSVAE